MTTHSNATVILDDIDKIRYLQRIDCGFKADSLEALFFNHADCRFYRITIKPVEQTLEAI